ncbi:hypothetical protein CO613_02835 [Lysobacteraceae bacterium NML07-0707]|nr:hypothetical protein CO613_02835 [Xanthomonadaceae bacterium NML07-0707]
MQGKIDIGKQKTLAPAQGKITERNHRQIVSCYRLQKFSRMRIFISLAAYCEPHLAFTLEQIFSKAALPERIFVGLIDQSHDDHAAWMAGKSWQWQVRHRKIDPALSEGVCWARHLAMQLHQGEEYFLQVDSHTFFFPGWDTALLDLHRQLERQLPKPLISAYPPPFEFDADGDPMVRRAAASEVSIIVPEDGEALRPDCATLRFRADWKAGTDLALGFHLAAGFIFARSRFIQEIPYDRLLYFHGEEQNLALRAWTRGWDIVHPRQDWIPLLHLYKQAGQDYASQHWSPAQEAAREICWQSLAARSDQRLLALVRGEITGIYGLGDVRNLQQFADFSGIDYRICQQA